MELDTMYDSDVSSTLLEHEQHGEDLLLEDVDDFEHDATSMPSMTALAASSSPKTAAGSDMAWLRRLEREMDTKLLLDAEKINDRIQRRRAHEEEMQQSLASFTLSGRQSAAVSSVHSSSKSSASSIANANASTESTDHSHLQITTPAAEAPQPLQPVDEWKEAFTEDGKKYFYNRRTRETSWTCPDNAIVVNRSDGATATSASTASDPATADSSTAARMATVTMQQANQTMYCTFCGSEWRVWELMAHMATCDVLQSHKAQRTAMYEEAVEIARELFVKQTIDVDTQTSDRYLHYASVYSVHHGADDDDGASSSAERAHVDPLALLKQRRRHTVHPTTTRHEAAESRHDDDVMQLNVDLDTKLSLLRLKRTTEVAARRQDAFEQCRYCQRSFAEGRLSKHEAVCPRVFGTEMTWNNHQASRKAKPSAKAATSKRPKPPTGGGHVAKSSLAGSFLEYQATLVTCPCCQRKFAPSGAQQHIDICQHVENKPKKMVPKSYAIAG